MQLRHSYLSGFLAIAVGFTAGIVIEAQKPGEVFPNQVVPTPQASPAPSPWPSYDPNSRQVLLADAEGTEEDEEEDGDDSLFGEEYYA